ncbi:uncharacterized protein LOC131672128 [Phymastichus coffea]|uniref:uncharacterized protein LOC131672128 n=1 Tax=Phymastichus coffea TaxID=108790 RepID=UPI00273B4C4E|nr:uncharacterized protein LOC131672128 [Phymastichus coffea]
MEHHEAVYEQIIDVSNPNQGSDFLSHHLVQEIVVPNDNNQESSMNCEIAGMDIILPNDCITVQDQCNRNVMIYNTDGMEQDKEAEQIILHESTKVEHILHVNNIGSSINYMENHKEVKVQEYILHDQTTYNQEDYQVANSVLITTGDTRDAGAVAETTTDHVTASIPISESTHVPTNHVSSDTYVIISSGQSIVNNIGEESKCVEEQEEDIKPKQNNAHMETRENLLVIENEVADGNLIPMTITELQVDSQIDSQIGSVNEENNENLTNTPVSKGSINAEPEKHFENSLPMEESQNGEIVTEGQILTNSDDIAVMAEFSTIEYSAEEEVGAAQDDKSEQVAEQLQEQVHEDVQGEAVKKELKESNNVAVVIETKGETIESKLELTGNEEVNYNQSSQEEDEIDLHLSTQSNDSHRKVIQDIFDDWQDENCEEDNNQSVGTFKDHQDSVEKELQNLLNDDAQQVQTVSSTNAAENAVSCDDNVEQSGNSLVEKSRSSKSDKARLQDKKSSERSTGKTSKSTLSRSSTKDKSHGHSSKSVNQDDTKKVHPRPGVKVPGSHLTSPIASTAEVTEALNKRLREKQKDLVVPKTADIVFVKKISQRLSNQLSQVVASMPPLTAGQQTPAANDLDKDKSIEEVVTATSKASSVSDNNELLAILEGDADPEWSNLNPENNKTSNPNSNASSSGKLDPALERELALKQLLELPNITSKKSAVSSSAPKKSNKKMPSKEKESTNKVPKEQTRMKPIKEEPRSNPTEDGEIISLDLADENSQKKTKKPQNENSQNTRNSAEIKVEIGIEESRSGRKRKLTEKAREHELAVKRQKVFKNKAAESKKLPQDDADGVKQKVDDAKSEQVRIDLESATDDKSAEVMTKQVKSDPKCSSPKTETKTIKSKVLPLKKSKLGLLKKNTSITRRKLAVKNLLRQKAVSKNAKPKIPAASSPKKADTTLLKSTSEKTVTPAGFAHKGKKVSEIDRLLQDEGVVNLLYDVKQPDSRKRLVPITKSQKKVMDVEKAERELKLRTKLVKNAVLRLRNSASTTVKISPRSRRSAASDQSMPQSEKKVSDVTKTNKPLSSAPSESTDFVIPAKIRNAADASRIIRRHSSSSFSSASASPRVSIDVPPESIKLDEFEALVKSKRKLSHDSIDKLDPKKTKKKAVISKGESEDKDESDKSPSKKATRSNAIIASKVPPKSKKVPKSRSSSEALWNDVKGASRDQDELSACLAEAVSALQSSINGGSSRSASTSTNRKRGHSKTQLDDEKLDNRKFSNKEINVRQHGHLAQLILTPSGPVSGIRNAITIPVMNEIREALSILRNDNDCRVVLLTSTGTSFCEGLELSYLQQSNREERKVRAEDMAKAVRDFVRSLAAFNKPIVAGVQGAAIGLGVTMLPLFDLVIASDKATFSTPYGKLGQIAEGAAVLTLSHSLGSAVTNELLLGGRTLTASEALRAGLVTRVLWPDRFQGELLPSLKVMSEQSAQAMEATKALLRHSLRKKLDVALESESFLLIQHWCSEECQEAIKAYIEEKGQ